MPRLGRWNHRKNTVQDFQQGNRAEHDTAEPNSQLLCHVIEAGVDFDIERRKAVIYFTVERRKTVIYLGVERRKAVVYLSVERREIGFQFAHIVFSGQALAQCVGDHNEHRLRLPGFKTDILQGLRRLERVEVDRVHALISSARLAALQSTRSLILTWRRGPRRALGQIDPL